MDSKRFGRFIAETRKEKNMTQADLAGKIGVTDKAVSRWERGIGFPDINTLEPLAAALDITVFELMHSEKKEMKNEAMPENEVVEIMNRAVEMAKENQRQERVSLWLGGTVLLATAIFVKAFHKTNVSVGGALFLGGFAALTVVSLYYYGKNHHDTQCRKIYGSFLLSGTLLLMVLFQLAGFGTDKIMWLVYGILFLSMILTYR